MITVRSTWSIRRMGLGFVGLAAACSDGVDSSAGLLEPMNANGRDVRPVEASQSADHSTNRAPTPVPGASLPQSLVSGQLINLEADSLFSDPDNDTLTYAASSSDTAVVYVVVNDVHVPSPQVAIKALRAGEADVTVTASDGHGGTSSLTATVTVRRNRRPTTTGKLPRHDIFVAQTVTLDVSSYFSDPDGDSLSYGAEPGCTGIIPGCTPVVRVSVAGSEVILTGLAEGRDRVRGYGPRCGRIRTNPRHQGCRGAEHASCGGAEATSAEALPGRYGRYRRESLLQRSGWTRVDLFRYVVEAGGFGGVGCRQPGHSGGRSGGSGGGTHGDGARPGRPRSLNHGRRTGARRPPSEGYAEPPGVPGPGEQPLA